MGEPRRPLARGRPAHRHLVRHAGARVLPGTPAVARAFPAPGLLLPAAAPAATALVVALLAGRTPIAGGGADAAFRADAGGIAAAIAVAAFAGGGALARLARVPLAAILLATAHVALGSPAEAPAGGAAALAALAAGAMAGVLGLRAAGERAGCPSVAAGAAAAAVLWTACAGLWWVDTLAASVPPDRRASVREAVLAVDPFTAAAYGVDGWDRLKDPHVYASTTVGTVPVRRPRPLETAALWTAAGLVAAAAARLLGPRPVTAVVGLPSATAQAP